MLDIIGIGVLCAIVTYICITIAFEINTHRQSKRLEQYCQMRLAELREERLNIGDGLIRKTRNEQ